MNFQLELLESASLFGTSSDKTPNQVILVAVTEGNRSLWVGSMVVECRDYDIEISCLSCGLSMFRIMFSEFEEWNSTLVMLPLCVPNVYYLGTLEYFNCDSIFLVVSRDSMNSDIWSKREELCTFGTHCAQCLPFTQAYHNLHSKREEL